MTFLKSMAGVYCVYKNLKQVFDHLFLSDEVF